MSEVIPPMPQAPPQPVCRAVQDCIPPTRQERDDLLAALRQYVADHDLVPPLALTELDAHARKAIGSAGVDAEYLPFAAVVLNNEIWRDTLAGIPFNRRLLLLPKCLRNSQRCAGDLDELGLLCRDCGLCAICMLRREAQKLGYVVLVAEGTPAVVSLVQTGQIEGIIGVSCLSSLERIFPCIEAAAVPGMAIPLLQDGCLDTQADLDWIWQALHLTNGQTSRRMDMDKLQHHVQEWFSPAAIAEVLGTSDGQTEQIAQAWLARSGKRWRPFLAACAFQAFQDDPQAPLPADFRKIALAVECFHKASLIHDDIEDNDALRYGQKTLHEEFGTPIALNVGDFLLGEGYRLIAESNSTPQAKEHMLRAAAAGHRCLCTGQGDELAWMRDPAPLTPTQVLDIFRRKTAPAFEVALRLGAIYAGTGPEVWDALATFSQALGVAYQVRDDLLDFTETGDGGTTDLDALRPSLLLALAYAHASAADRPVLEKLWRRDPTAVLLASRLTELVTQPSVRAEAQRMLGEYKHRAILALGPLKNSHLKGLLRRVVAKIFGDLELHAAQTPRERGPA